MHIRQTPYLSLHTIFLVSAQLVDVFILCLFLLLMKTFWYVSAFQRTQNDETVGY